MSTALVVVGGDALDPRAVTQWLEHHTDSTIVIAADSGYDHAVAAGLQVHIVVGDLDSISPDGRARLHADTIEVETHPTDKDFTDAELALRAAASRGVERITVLGGGGDRLDHSLGALFALADPSLAHIAVEAWWGEAHIVVLQGPATRTVAGRAGEVISLLPVGGPAHGLTTRGVQYALDDDTLHPTASRGVSNVLTDDRAHITVRSGALLVVRPHALRPLDKEMTS